MSRRTRWLLVIAAACSLGAVAIGILSTRDKDVSASGTILFVRQASEHGISGSAVYRADVRTGMCRRLRTVPVADDSRPKLWPDGRHVVSVGIAAGQPTSIIDTIDGSSIRIASGRVGYLTWSRDARTLAFIEGNKARFVDSLGRSKRTFVPHPLTPWSPDGRRVAFVRTTGDGRAGTLKTVLVVAPIEDLDRGTVVYQEPNPYGESPDAVWSADGTTLLFRRAGAGLALDVTTGRIGPTTTPFGVKWSPDGKQALFTSTGPHRAEDVFVMSADGSERRRLTTSRLPPLGVPQAGSTASGWSPDGQWIAYGRKWSLSIMRRDGSDARAVCRMPLGELPGETVWAS